MDTRNRNWLIGFVLFVAIAISTGYLLWRKAPDAASTAISKTAATRPATRPSLRARPKALKTVDVAELLSPSEIRPSPDPRISNLLDTYNRAQDRLAVADLQGSCTWDIDGSAANRPMSIKYDRPADQATIVCGPDSCKVAAAKVTMNFDSAMTVDAHYLLMFQKYDGSKFKLSTDGIEEGKIVAESDTDRLTFDAQTGRLIECAIQTPSGQLIATFSDFTPIAGQIVPSLVSLEIPRNMFPFKIKNNSGQITFTIDPAKSQLTTALP